MDYLEKRLSEYLDDLLVADNLLPIRRSELQGGGGRFGFGMVVMIKEPPRVNFKIEVFPNEIEEPHFRVSYQGQTCRFKIVDCEPMKAEAKKGIPSQIQKIMKQIKKTWEDNKEEIVKAWQDSRPSDQNHGHQKIR